MAVARVALKRQARYALRSRLYFVLYTLTLTHFIYIAKHIGALRRLMLYTLHSTLLHHHVGETVPSAAAAPHRIDGDLASTTYNVQSINYKVAPHRRRPGKYNV